MWNCSNIQMSWRRIYQIYIIKVIRSKQLLMDLIKLLLDYFVTLCLTSWSA